MSDVDDLAAAFIQAAPDGQSYARNYGVINVVPGASRDGKAQVYILVGTTNLAVPYLDSYLTPTIGDMVRVEFDSGCPIITGRVIGLPTF